MMTNIGKILFFTLFFTIFSPHIQADKNATIEMTTHASVIFNTLCAKCHEGECSGRLSFNTGSKTATRHIAHYAEDTNLTSAEADAFFALLNYMKKECAIYMPDDGSWKPEYLSRFTLPSHQAYFIPLGTLKKGRYRLMIKTKEPIPFKLEILSSKIDNLFQQSVSPAHNHYIFHFSVKEPVTAFVRMRSSKPLYLLSLELKPEE